MEYNAFLTGLIWFAIGLGVAHLYHKNKASADPHSYRDELRALQDKYDELRKRFTSLENRTPAPTPAPTPAQATAPIQPQQVETVELTADKVEILSERSSAPDAGAKTYGLGEEADNNDRILGLDKTKE